MNRSNPAAMINGLVAEAVLLDSKGEVATQTLLCFGALPSGRPRM